MKSIMSGGPQYSLSPFNGSFSRAVLLPVSIRILSQRHTRRHTLSQWVGSERVIRCIYLAIVDRIRNLLVAGGEGAQLFINQVPA